jgi:para-nitrobenzyl esterase
MSQIVSAVDTTPIQGGVVTMAFGANTDGYVLPQEPLAALENGQFNQVPFVIGSNANEMLPFAPPMTQEFYEAAVHKSLEPIQPGLAEEALALYPVGDGSSEYESVRHAYAALVSDAQFTCNARAIARAAAQGGAPVYRYFFSKTLDSPLLERLGSFHGLELIYVFQHIQDMDNYTASNADLALQRDLLGYWTRFAETGNPNGSGAPEWLLYDSTMDNYLELGTVIQAGAGLRSAQCDFWDRVSQIRQVEFSE